MTILGRQGRAAGLALMGLVGLAGQALGDEAPPVPRQQQGTESGFAVFQRNCTQCHGNPQAAERAPDPSALRQMSPERILDALTTGPMVPMAAGLSDAQKRRVAEFMGGRPLGSASAGAVSAMAGRCTRPLQLDDLAGWNGWGAGAANTRFQPDPGLTAAQIPGLKLRWAFGFPHGVSAYAQPSVVGGTVFVGSDIGYVYALDARTGCAYWSFQAKGAVRPAVSVGPIAHGRHAAYFGDAKANVYAVEAETGTLLWTTHVDGHFSARITGAPALWRDRLYVPVSASEEFAAASPSFPCCTFRGSVVALDAATGAQVWKSYVIPETPRPTRRNHAGTQLWAPAGGSIWNAPTLDPARNALYVGTGDAETMPASPNSDAVLALDMTTGKQLWVHQATSGDAFLGGCDAPDASEACPRPNGPDFDIGNSPILRRLADGSRVVLAGTKDAQVLALDPDHAGAVRWQVRLKEKPAGAFSWGIIFGGAADGERAYYPLALGLMAAVDLAGGTTAWTAPLDAGRYAAAATAIPGAVFVGGADGRLIALSTADGHRLWEVDTAHDFATVNEVPAHGGSMGGPGPVVAGGMVFVGSGYSVGAGTPGNVLLAFGAGG